MKVGMLQRATFLILFLLILCYFSLGYITRLHCRRHGNFSIIKSNTRCSGTVERSLDGLTRSECVLSCLTCDNCSFVNYHPKNLACELMNAEGNQKSEVGWQFLSTNYGTRNRGPICRSLSPCGVTEACVDTCFEDDQVGYKCMANQFKEIYSYPYAYPTSEYPANYLQDGDNSTYVGTQVTRYSKIYLYHHVAKPIRFVTIRLQSIVSRSFIRIDHQFCSDVPEVAEVDLVVECSSYLVGRIVAFTHASRSPQGLHVYEMHAYGDA